jgi:hypothetical protein
MDQTFVQAAMGAASHVASTAGALVLFVLVAGLRLARASRDASGSRGEGAS